MDGGGEVHPMGSHGLDHVLEASAGSTGSTGSTGSIVWHSLENKMKKRVDKLTMKRIKQRPRLSAGYTGKRLPSFSAVLMRPQVDEDCHEK